MEKTLEDCLYQAIVEGDQETIVQKLLRGANPNTITSHGKTCLGETAHLGNTSILKLLLDVCTSSSQDKRSPISSSSHKQYFKTQKRKLNCTQQDETVIKCKNLSDKIGRDSYVRCPDSRKNIELKNRGYFVFIHEEDSHADDNLCNILRSPVSPVSLTPSPQADLEWDEEIGNFAPVTSEDETWSSMYKWYAAILESTGAALASASVVSSGIDQQDTFLRTALHYAAEQGHVGALKMLLNAGCKVDIPAAEGLTALHVAIIRNREEVVKLLLAAGSRVNSKTHEKMTALHFAASRGYLTLVNSLVNSGAYVDARDTNERTALYLAAGRGHEHVVKYLISAGANVNSEEIHGYTPLCEAVWQKYTSVVEELLSSGARITHSHKLLHNAIMQKQEQIVKILSTYTGGINFHNENGNTPLLLATRLSQPKIARILLENGANVNSSNSLTGATALHIAVESVDSPEEFEAFLLCFLEYNINMNSIALTGDTALNRALLLHRDHAVFLLVKHGADVNSWDLQSCGLDNLTIASRRQSPDLSRLLIKAGHYIPQIDYNVPLPKPGTTANYLYHACTQPLNLTDLCRIRIRKMSSHQIIHEFIKSLPLPKSLIRFLMLEDE